MFEDKKKEISVKCFKFHKREKKSQETLSTGADLQRAIKTLRVEPLCIKISECEQNGHNFTKNNVLKRKTLKKTAA